MGGSSIDDDWEVSFCNVPRTVVLVGRTGNGKSATGNTILGRKEFDSKRSSNGVTSTCKLQSAALMDGQQVNVIDTPGLFDYSAKSEFIGKEICKCIDLAKDGIHAVVLVLTTLSRFSQEEESAIRNLQTLFGSKISDYMIVVFTGGDDLEDNDETLDDYLGRDIPKPLKEILSLCGNRRVLFDNKTKDESKRVEQVQQLLALVNLVLEKNGGRPYSDEIFAEAKKGALKVRELQEVSSLKEYSKTEISHLNEQMQRAHEVQLKIITEMVESKMRETTMVLEQKLEEERAARLKAEDTSLKAQKRSQDEIQKLRDDLQKAEEELRKKGETKCGIL